MRALLNKCFLKYLVLPFFILLNLSCSAGSSLNLIQYRKDGAVKLNIYLKGSLQNPAFSPDGKSVVFTRFRNGYNNPPADIYIFNLETETLRELVSDGNGNINLPGSCWNGLTGSIIFSSDRDPHDEIFKIIENGKPGDELKITSRGDKVSYEPTFSPDGKWIVFESHPIDVEGDGIVTKYSVDGLSGFMELTETGDDCRQPNWSPKGGIILYQKKEEGQWDIWTMNSDGANKILVTGFEGNKTDGVFSPDGNYMIFSYEKSGMEFANIYRVSLNGGSPGRLTNFSGYDGAVSVSPDGTRIVFESSPGDPDEIGKTSIWILDLK